METLLYKLKWNMRNFLVFAPMMLIFIDRYFKHLTRVSVTFAHACQGLEHEPIG